MKYLWQHFARCFVALALGSTVSSSSVDFVPFADLIEERATPGAQAKQAPACALTDNDFNTVLSMTYSDVDSGTGKPIRVQVDSTITKADDIQKSSELSSSRLTVHLDSQLVFATNKTIAPDGTLKGSIDWSAPGAPAHHAVLSVDKNNLTTGSVDGKGFAPFHATAADASNALQSRDQPLLQLPPSQQLNISVPQLKDAIKKGMQACKSQIDSHYKATSNVTTHAMLMPRDDRTTDLGHASATYVTGSCLGCVATAQAAVWAAAFACAVSTCVETFGLGCAACYAGEAVASFQASETCLFSGACCPVNCGSGSYPFNPPDCCLGGETCLNSQDGACCAAGKQTCLGKECCSSDQSCISLGPQHGTCCPQDAICGGQCCPSGTDVCVGGNTCCLPTDVCGSLCCNPIDPTSSGPGLGSPKFCADQSRSLCCPTGQVAVDGICCQSGAINCQGQCCFGTCSPSGQCQSEPTDAQCQSLGYLGNCSTLNGCTGGARQCDPNGCCEEIPR